MAILLESCGEPDIGNADIHIVYLIQVFFTDGAVQTTVHDQQLPLTLRWLSEDQRLITDCR